jgi:WD40 repeat protein
MRVLTGSVEQPLDLLAFGAGGHVAGGWADIRYAEHVDVWDLATGELIRTEKKSNRDAVALAFTPDGRSLLIGETPGLAVLNVGTWERREVTLLPHATTRFALFPDGRRLFVTVARGASGRLLCTNLTDAGVSREIWHFDGELYARFDAPAVHPDGNRVAAAQRYIAGVSRQLITIRDADSGKTLAVNHVDPAEPIWQFAFTTDGAKLLARIPGRAVRVLDAENVESVGELVHKGRAFVTGIAVHPGGKAIACSRNDGTVWFWDPTTLREIRSFDWKLGKLVSVAFSPDGALAAAGTEDGQVIVWDVDL